VVLLTEKVELSEFKLRKFLVICIIVIIAGVWGYFFPGSLSLASSSSIAGIAISPQVLLLGCLLISLFFLFLGLVREWKFQIGDYLVIQPKHSLLLGSGFVIITAFAFNGLNIIGFFVYYYEIFLISLYTLVSLTYIPTAIVGLIGAGCLVLGFQLYRKKSYLKFWKFFIDKYHTDNLLILGVVFLVLMYFLFTLYQPGYVETAGVVESDGILKSIHGLPLDSNMLEALSSYYLNLVFFLYPIILLICGIILSKYSLKKPTAPIPIIGESLKNAHIVPTIKREKFSFKGFETVEIQFLPSLLKGILLRIILLLGLIIALIVAIIGILWLFNIDSLLPTSVEEFAQINILTDPIFSFSFIESSLVGLFIISVLLLVITFIPKAVRPFIDERVFRYTARRLLSMIPMFIGISIISYSLMLATGNPIDLIMSRQPPGPGRDLLYANLLRIYGLNAPPQSQWFNWFFHFIMGDLGNSIHGGRLVTEAIGIRLLPTLEISILPLILSILIAIPLGIFAALRQYSWEDNLIAIFVSLGLAVPIFLLIILAILAFTYYIPILPAGGISTPWNSAEGVNLIYVDLYFNTFIGWLFDWETWDLLFHLIIPVGAITLISLALYVRLVRSGYLEVVRQDFILSAQAYGFDERTIIFRHSLRNVLIPLVTYIGLSIGTLLGGAPLTETTLSWPGLGYYGVISIQSYDYPVVMGLIMVTAVLILLANLFTDLLYSVVDPRVTLE
jgi:peptide/nickel transport system permease protein